MPAGLVKQNQKQLGRAPRGAIWFSIVWIVRGVARGRPQASRAPFPIVRRLRDDLASPDVRRLLPKHADPKRNRKRGRDGSDVIRVPADRARDGTEFVALWDARSNGENQRMKMKKQPEAARH